MEGQGGISGWRSDGHVKDVVLRVIMEVVMVVMEVGLRVRMVVVIVVVVLVVVEKLNFNFIYCFVISLIVKFKLFCTFLYLEINSAEHFNN